jgi:hypothetical protein
MTIKINLKAARLTGLSTSWRDTASLLLETSSRSRPTIACQLAAVRDRLKPRPETGDGGTGVLRLPTFITAEPPILTPSRVRLAYAVAVTTDVLQFLLGPIGWAGADEILDVVATALIWRVLGFHALLLPTFLIELLPVTDMLPTWTGCVALVIGLRRRQQSGQPPPEHGPVIDV